MVPWGCAGVRPVWARPHSPSFIPARASAFGLGPSGLRPRAQRCEVSASTCAREGSTLVSLDFPMILMSLAQLLIWCPYLDLKQVSSATPPPLAYLRRSLACCAAPLHKREVTHSVGLCKTTQICVVPCRPPVVPSFFCVVPCRPSFKEIKEIPFYFQKTRTTGDDTKIRGDDRRTTGDDADSRGNVAESFE